MQKFSAKLDDPQVFSWADALSKAEFQHFFDQTVVRYYEIIPALRTHESFLRTKGALREQIQFPSEGKFILEKLVRYRTKFEQTSSKKAEDILNLKAALDAIYELDSAITLCNQEAQTLREYHSKRGYVAWLLSLDVPSTMAKELPFRDQVMRATFPSKAQYFAGINTVYDSLARLAIQKRKGLASVLATDFLTIDDFDKILGPKDLERFVFDEFRAHQLAQADRIYGK